MTDHDIIHKVQDFFDNPNMRVNSTDLLNGDNVNTAVAERMINAYQRFMSNQTFEKQIEFECSLRNFLLFLKTSVTIKDYNLLTPNCFGLKVNYSNDSIYANFELPNYVN